MFTLEGSGNETNHETLETWGQGWFTEGGSLVLYLLSGGLLLVGVNGIQGREGRMNRRKTIKMAVVPSDTKLQN